MLRMPPQGPHVNDHNRLLERIFDGYSYICRRIVPNITYVQCKEHQSRRNCNGRGKIIDNTFILTSPHNHRPNMMLQPVENFSRDLYESTTRSFRSVQSIFESVRQLHREAAAMLIKKNVLRSMRSWRQHVELPHRLTYEEFDEFLNSEEQQGICSHDRGDLTATLRRNAEVALAMPYYDLNLLQQMEACTTFYVTSTTLTIPNNLTQTVQVAIVIATYHNHAFPLVFSFMKSRASEAYGDSLEAVRLLMNPQKIYTDFESRLHESLAQKFPLAIIKGHFYGYCNAVVGEAKKRNLDIAGNEDVQDILQRVVGLALLPAGRILDAYQVIRYAARHMTPELDEFVQYINTAWIETVTPEVFSVYSDIEAITDCPVTSVKVLANLVGNDKGIWNFHRAIVNIHGRSYKDRDALNEHNRNQKQTPRVRSMVNLSQLRESWRLLETGKISNERFLTKCSAQVNDLIQEILYTNEPVPDDIQLVGPVAENENADDVDDPVPGDNIIVPEAAQAIAVAPPAPEIAAAPGAQVIAMAPAMAAASAAPAIAVDQAVPVGVVAQPYDLRCVICRDNWIKYMCIPCGHFSICLQCKDELIQMARLQNRQVTCPMCRLVVTDFLRSYIPGANYE